MLGTLIFGIIIVLIVFGYTYLYPKVKRQSSRFQKTVITTTTTDGEATSPTQRKVKIVTPVDDANAHLSVARKSKTMDKSALTLDMSHRSLRMLPAELKTGFNQYNHLDLSHNHLAVLPAWFFTTDWTDRLIKLDLAHNNFFELPSGLDKLVNLQHLDVSYNRLGDFPNVLLKCQKLQSLNIAGNGLVFLSPDINKLENLEELNISFNSLSMLPDSLSQLKKLKSFDVHNNKFVGSIHQVLKDLQQANPQVNIAQIDEKRKSIVKNSIKNRTKTKSDRIHALKELLKSEEVFNKYLDVLFQQYFAPLTMNKHENAVLKFNEIEIPEEKRKSLFPLGLQSIVNFNHELLKELRKCIDIEKEATLDESLVGDIFKSRAVFFKIYTSYISGYHSAHRALMDYINENEAFAMKIQQGRSLANCNGVDLPSLLIMPIQRIPRYVLLLKAVLDNTESMHPDYKNLEGAVQAMGEIAAFVNSKILEAANLRKVMDIQEELNFEDLVQPHRTFVKEGKLTMKKKDQDASASNQVKIYLFNDLLVLTEFKILYALFGDFVRRFTLDEIELVDNKSDDCDFEIAIRSRNKYYQLHASTPKEKNDWIELINKYKNEL